MPARSLNRFSPLRSALVWLKRQYLTRLWGMDIAPTAQFSLSAHFDRTNPTGIHIGAHSYIAFDVAVLTHDRTRALYADTHIGKNCFVGARSIILPGVRIGDGSVVGAGSVVVADVPARCVVAGNPARIIRDGIDVGAFGQFRSQAE